MSESEGDFSFKQESEAKTGLETTKASDGFLDKIAKSISGGALDNVPKFYFLTAAKWTVLGGMALNVGHEVATNTAMGHFAESLAIGAALTLAAEGAKYIAKKRVNSSATK